VLGASLLALTALVYAVALGGPFLLDDVVNVFPARPRSVGLQGLLEVVLENTSGPLGRPIAVSTFALQYLGGLEAAFFFKSVNLAIHLVNSAMLMLVADRLLGVEDTACGRENGGDGRRRAIALTACVGLFALHPLQVSTVMYVVQRMTLMSQLFGLAALLLYLEARTREDLDPRRRTLLAVSVLPLIALSTLCKEVGVLFVLYAGLIEVTVLRGRHLLPCAVPSAKSEALSSGAAQAVLVAGLGALAGAFGLLVRTGALDPLLIGYESREFTLLERLATQPIVIVDYLRMLLLPDPSAMTFYHDHVRVDEWSAAWVGLALAVLALILAVMVALLPRLPLASAGIGIYLASHALESTVFPLELMFEHRNYIGLAGLALATASVLGRFPRTASTAVTGAMVIALSIMTFQRCLVWADELTINRFAVEHAPESLRARSAYALSLARADDVDGALEQLELASRLVPRNPYFVLEILQTKALNGGATEEDVKRAGRTLVSGRFDPSVETVLGDLLRHLRAGLLRGVDAAAVSSLYADAERRYEELASARVLARLRARAAEAHLLAGRHGGALASLERAVELSPADPALRLRQLEVRAGLEPASVTALELRHLAGRIGSFDSRQLERLSAVVEHLARVRED